MKKLHVSAEPRENEELLQKDSLDCRSATSTRSCQRITQVSIRTEAAIMS